MFKFPKFLIFFIAVAVSFVLYGQSLKLNREYQMLQKFKDACRLYNYTDQNCNFYLRFDVPYEEIVAKNNQKLFFFNVFIVCLIVQLFAVFAAVEKEIFISVISMAPLFFYVSTSKEGWLVPIYIFFIPLFAYFFSRLKRLAFNKIPNWFT